MTLNDLTKIASFSKNLITDLKMVFGTGTTLIINEKKDIVKVIKCLENRGILLKETTIKIISQNENFTTLLDQ